MAPDDLREVAKKEKGAVAAKLRKYAYRPHLAGSSVALGPDGKRLLVVDPDAGTVVEIDPKDKTVKTTTRVCARPEQVAVAPSGEAFVTCRGSGEVVALDTTLTETARASLGPDAFGLALSPKGDTVFVTTGSDAKLHALSTALAPKWSVDVPADPRGVAISPDGKRAVVAHLQSSGPSVVSLRSHKKKTVALPNVRDGWPSELLNTGKRKRPERIARGSFAVAMTPGGTRAVVPYVLVNSGSEIQSFVPGCYANGSQLPVAVTLAALDLRRSKVQRPTPIELKKNDPRRRFGSFGNVNQMGKLGVVRAAVHDPVRSQVLAVGEGSGTMMAFDTSKADPTSAPLRHWELGSPARGVAVDPQGKIAYVHLPFDHAVAIVPLADSAYTVFQRISIGEDELDDAVARGRKLFHKANDSRITGITGVSCATCHAEGRSDGVSWLLDGKPVQTPLLATRTDLMGRLRWSGASPDLGHAISEAVKRLQGTGLPEEDQKALVAFLTSGKDVMSLPPRPTPAEDGKKLFADAGCATCHDPDNSYTDAKLHTFRGDKIRTPALRGLALTAPYYHDGSAPTLTAVLTAHEAGNPMSVGNRFEKTEIAALEAFLKTL